MECFTLQAICNGIHSTFDSIQHFQVLFFLDILLKLGYF